MPTMYSIIQIGRLILSTSTHDVEQQMEWTKENFGPFSAVCAHVGAVARRCGAVVDYFKFILPTYNNNNNNNERGHGPRTATGVFLNDEC